MKLKPSQAKFIVKQGIGVLFALAIGYAIKTEKKIDAKIDEHYASKTQSETQEN